MPSNPCPTCQHIFPDTHRCGSPAMRGETHCYFHHPDRRPVQDTYAHRSRRGFDITLPNDPAALQHALHQVIRRLAANKLDVHRASLLLYSLQIASQSIPRGTAISTPATPFAIPSSRAA